MNRPMTQALNAATDLGADLRSTARALAFHARLGASRRRGPRLFVFRDGGIGDILCTLPSLDALRARDPNATIVYAAYKAFHPLLHMSGLVDVLIESGGYRKWGRATDRCYDHVYRPYYEDEIWTGLPLVHIVDDFARKIGVTLRDRQPRLSVPAELRERLRPEVEALRRGSSPVIAAQVGPSWAVRMWPDAHWVALVRRLAAERDAAVVLLGADFHQESGRAVTARVPGAVDWIGRHSLPETAAVLSLCDQFVGIDSGLLHMAGAVGTPGVGLFGPVDPSLRLPPVTPAVGVCAPLADVPCLGCHHRIPRAHWKSGCPQDIACMRAITPDAVFDALASLPRRQLLQIK